jgi:hypothetical protein
VCPYEDLAMLDLDRKNRDPEVSRFHHLSGADIEIPAVQRAGHDETFKISGSKGIVRFQTMVVNCIKSAVYVKDRDPRSLDV